MIGDIQARNEMNAAITGGKPFKSYKKTILGKVLINIMDVITKETEAVLLEGDPDRNDPDCFYHTWSEAEDIFFRKAPYNRDHIKTGRIVPVKVEELPKPEKTLETSSDEELVELVNSPFLKLQNALNGTNSEAVLFRMLNIAKREDKSSKITGAIEARLSEVQEEKYATPKNIVIEK